MKFLMIVLTLSLGSLFAQAYTTRGPWVYKFTGSLQGPKCSCSGDRAVLVIKNDGYRYSEWRVVYPKIAFSDYEACYQYLDDNYRSLGCGFLSK